MLGMSNNGFDKNFALKSSRFYSSSAEKTLGNWFVYELSNELYDTLSEFIDERGKDVDEELAAFTIKFARDILKQIEAFPENKFKYTRISRIIAEEETPDILTAFNSKVIASVISEALKEQMEICEICPTRCAFNPEVMCNMFDEGPY